MGGKTQTPGVIVEIGNDWLKIAQPELSKSGLSFPRLSLVKIVSADSGVAKIIGDIYKKQKFPRDPVTAIIPVQLVNIRMLEMPSTDPVEIRDMIDFQAAKQTPYSKDEIIFDYRLLGSAREGFTRVMLVIVQRSVLRQRYSIFEEAGIEVGRMTVSSEGLLACCSRMGVSGAAAFLDVDSFFSELIIVSNGVPLFTRSILVGGNHLVDDFDKASARLSAEVKRSLEAFAAEAPEAETGGLMLSGAGVRIEGLADALSGALDVKVQVVDFLQKVRKTGDVSLSQPNYKAVSLTAVAGAGMAPDELNFNLVPDSVRLRKSLVSKAKSLSSFGYLTIAAFAAISVYTTSRIAYLEDRLAKLKAEVARTKPIAEKVMEKQEIARLVRDRSNADFAAVNILSAVHSALPEGMMLSEITINSEENRITIKGSTESRREINDFTKALETTALFIEVKSTGQITTDQETKKQIFEISGTLEKENES